MPYRKGIRCLQKFIWGSDFPEAAYHNNLKHNITQVLKNDEEKPQDWWELNPAYRRNKDWLGFLKEDSDVLEFLPRL